MNEGSCTEVLDLEREVLGFIPGPLRLPGQYRDSLRVRLTGIMMSTVTSLRNLRPFKGLRGSVSR